jgi:hypothetical protein
MKDTIIITSIYEPFWGTEEFLYSVNRLNLPVYNAFTRKKFTGNGDVHRMLYEAYKKFETEYKYVVYSDGADTYFLRSFTPPDNKVIFSAEKACYPNPERAIDFPITTSPWKYLNGGNCCAPASLMIEFYERYGLDKLSGDVNGQKESTTAYLQGVKDGFPIELDTNCELFQTTAFEDAGDFELTEKGLYNLKTGTHPHILHGNGRTDMSTIYDYFKIWPKEFTK